MNATVPMSDGIAPIPSIASLRSKIHAGLRTTLQQAREVGNDPGRSRFASNGPSRTLRHHRVVGAEISGASWQTEMADPLVAFSVHAPSKGKAYWKQVNNLLDQIKKIADGREVVTLRTARPFDPPTTPVAFAVTAVGEGICSSFHPSAVL